jgi:hypothetical protein
MKLSTLLAGTAFLATLAASASAQNPMLNEIYISMTGTDTSEFIELKGAPGTALTGFMKRIDKGVQVLNVADVASLDATVVALQS